MNAHCVFFEALFHNWPVMMGVIKMAMASGCEFDSGRPVQRRDSHQISIANPPAMMAPTTLTHRGIVMPLTRTSQP